MHTAEVETDLDKAEGMIRYLFNDVQLLKDGRHLQAEQMYRRSEQPLSKTISASRHSLRALLYYCEALCDTR